MNGAAPKTGEKRLPFDPSRENIFKLIPHQSDMAGYSYVDTLSRSIY